VGLSSVPVAFSKTVWSETPYRLPINTGSSQRMKYWLGYDDTQNGCNAHIDEFAKDVKVTNL